MDNARRFGAYHRQYVSNGADSRQQQRVGYQGGRGW